MVPGWSLGPLWGGLRPGGAGQQKGGRSHDRVDGLRGVVRVLKNKGCAQDPDEPLHSLQPASPGRRLWGRKMGKGVSEDRSKPGRAIQVHMRSQTSGGLTRVAKEKSLSQDA
eukprot:1160221-Pelagomonas_calceolata.AAC.3